MLSKKKEMKRQDRDIKSKNEIITVIIMTREKRKINI